MFDAVGGVLTVPESQLDAVTAVSGSGPAYFFLMVEALVDAGVAVGLPQAGGDRSGGCRRWPDRRRCCWNGSTASGRRRGDGHRMDTSAGAAARDGHLAGRHHRRWAAGTRARWAAGGRRRRRRGRKNTL